MLVGNFSGCRHPDDTRGDTAISIARSSVIRRIVKNRILEGTCHNFSKTGYFFPKSNYAKRKNVTGPFKSTLLVARVQFQDTLRNNYDEDARSVSRNCWAKCTIVPQNRLGAQFVLTATEAIMMTNETSELSQQSLDVTQLQDGSVVTVSTRNSTYRLTMCDVEHRMASVEGGSLFAEPMVARIEGTPLENGDVQVGIIQPGMRLEIVAAGNQRIVTSPIQSFDVAA